MYRSVFSASYHKSRIMHKEDFPGYWWLFYLQNYLTYYQIIMTIVKRQRKTWRHRDTRYSYIFKGHVESVWKSYGLFLLFSYMKVLNEEARIAVRWTPLKSRWMHVCTDIHIWKERSGCICIFPHNKENIKIEF